ncbi:MAG: hypothetical protein QOD63_1090 [Actinomycetota bacterium]|nr:hypothetical protein [Actinomycetota bacterium]
MTRLIHLHLTTQATARNTARAIANRWHNRATNDDGVTTLEWVVLTLGVLLVATVAVAGVTAAINSRLAQIK